jgi:hypothetical protein
VVVVNEAFASRYYPGARKPMVAIAVQAWQAFVGWLTS